MLFHGSLGRLDNIMAFTFIRGLWGIYDQSHDLIRRRYKMDTDIKNTLGNKYTVPFTTYVMGTTNMEQLQKVNKFPCVLVNQAPFMFDLVKFQYRNKLEVIKFAMFEQNCDEIVYLDWDCSPVLQQNDMFIEKLRQKSSFQANLAQYIHPKCHWRRTDIRKVPNGGFLYINDKQLVLKAIQCWEKHQQQNDEIAWAQMVDDLMGGWKGVDEYYARFEPMVCKLSHNTPYLDKATQYTPYFIHYHGRPTGRHKARV